MVGQALNFLDVSTRHWPPSDDSIADSVEACMFQFDRFKEFQMGLLPEVRQQLMDTFAELGNSR